MVHFFGGVSLDGCFDTPGSFLGCIVGKLLWPECYEFDIKMPKINMGIFVVLVIF